MGDPVLIREVVDRIVAEWRGDDGTTCREPDCREQPNGLDGFCREHSRERERDGRWETRQLDLEEEQ